MSSLFDLLGDQISDGTIQQIGRMVGADSQATRGVVEGAIPLLVSALAGNANQAGGADAIFGALNRDHDGSIFDDLAGFLTGGTAASDGAGILGHVLGGRQGNVVSALSGSSGLSAQKVMQILAMVAPLVMGALGKVQRQRGLDSGGLSDLLQGERSRVAQHSPGMMGMLEQMLDRDGDGSMMDDLASTGMSVLGGLLGGRR